jgi:hypothetical protein
MKIKRSGRSGVESVPAEAVWARAVGTPNGALAAINKIVRAVSLEVILLASGEILRFQGESNVCQWEVSIGL